MPDQPENLTGKKKMATQQDKDGMTDKLVGVPLGSTDKRDGQKEQGGMRLS